MHYWDSERAFVRDGIRQAPINIIILHDVQFTKKELSPNHLCLCKIFQFQLSNAVHGATLSSH